MPTTKMRLLTTVTCALVALVTAAPFPHAPTSDHALEEHPNEVDSMPLGSIIKREVPIGPDEENGPLDAGLGMGSLTHEQMEDLLIESASVDKVVEYLKDQINQMQEEQDSARPEYLSDEEIEKAKEKFNEEQLKEEKEGKMPTSEQGFKDGLREKHKKEEKKAHEEYESLAKGTKISKDQLNRILYIEDYSGKTLNRTLWEKQLPWANTFTRYVAVNQMKYLENMSHRQMDELLWETADGGKMKSILHSKIKQAGEKFLKPKVKGSLSEAYFRDFKGRFMKMFAMPGPMEPFFWNMSHHELEELLLNSCSGAKLYNRLFQYLIGTKSTDEPELGDGFDQKVTSEEADQLLETKGIDGLSVDDVVAMVERWAANRSKDNLDMGPLPIATADQLDTDRIYRLSHKTMDDVLLDTFNHIEILNAMYDKQQGGVEERDNAMMMSLDKPFQPDKRVDKSAKMACEGLSGGYEGMSLC